MQQIAHSRACKVFEKRLHIVEFCIFCVRFLVEIAYIII